MHLPPSNLRGPSVARSHTVPEEFYRLTHGSDVERTQKRAVLTEPHVGVGPHERWERLKNPPISKHSASRAAETVCWGACTIRDAQMLGVHAPRVYYTPPAEDLLTSTCGPCALHTRKMQQCERHAPRLLDENDNYTVGSAACTLACCRSVISKRLNRLLQNNTYRVGDGEGDETSRKLQRKFSHEFSGCRFIFVDIGGNTGASTELWYAMGDARADGEGIRPERGHTLPRDFRALYGADAPIGAGIKASLRRQFCAAIFEPNPVFTSRLDSLVARLNVQIQQGASPHVKLFADTAVSLRGGPLTFYYPEGDKQSTVGSLLSPVARERVGGLRVTAMTNSTVASIGIGDLVRALALHAERIVIKLDVEDMELPLMHALAMSGGLCSPKLTDFFVESGMLAAATILIQSTACGAHQLQPTVNLRRWV